MQSPIERMLATASVVQVRWAACLAVVSLTLGGCLVGAPAALGASGCPTQSLPEDYPWLTVTVLSQADSYAESPAVPPEPYGSGQIYVKGPSPMSLRVQVLLYPADPTKQDWINWGDGTATELQRVPCYDTIGKHYADVVSGTFEHAFTAPANTFPELPAEDYIQLVECDPASGDCPTATKPCQYGSGCGAISFGSTSPSGLKLRPPADFQMVYVATYDPNATPVGSGPPPPLPTADFGWTLGAAKGRQVTFSGSLSNDTAASYSWDFGDGTTGSGQNPVHTYASYGHDYPVTLTVRDAEGTSFTATKTVTTGTGNDPPTARFTLMPFNTSCDPLDVRLDASASRDPDGHIVNYRWTFGDGRAVDGPVSVLDHDYLNVPKGTHTFRVSLTVTDNGGGSGPASDTVSGTVTLPTANYVAPQLASYKDYLELQGLAQEYDRAANEASNESRRALDEEFPEWLKELTLALASGGLEPEVQAIANSLAPNAEHAIETGVSILEGPHGYHEAQGIVPTINAIAMAFSSKGLELIAAGLHERKRAYFQQWQAETRAGLEPPCDHRTTVNPVFDSRSGWNMSSAVRGAADLPASASASMLGAVTSLHAGATSAALSPVSLGKESRTIVRIRTRLGRVLAGLGTPRAAANAPALARTLASELARMLDHHAATLRSGLPAAAGTVRFRIRNPTAVRSAQLELTAPRVLRPILEAYGLDQKAIDVLVRRRARALPSSGVMSISSSVTNEEVTGERREAALLRSLAATLASHDQPLSVYLRAVTPRSLAAFKAHGLRVSCRSNRSGTCTLQLLAGSGSGRTVLAKARLLLVGRRTSKATLKLRAPATGLLRASSRLELVATVADATGNVSHRSLTVRLGP